MNPVVTMMVAAVLRFLKSNSLPYQSDLICHSCLILRTCEHAVGFAGSGLHSDTASIARVCREVATPNTAAKTTKIGTSPRSRSWAWLAGMTDACTGKAISKSNGICN